jgi:sigma-B regulation protein RsbU (phosphoserine phosphatase)
MRSSRLYRLLLILLVAASFFQVGSVAHVMRMLREGGSVPAADLSIEVPTNRISSGPYRGWTIVAIEGQPFYEGRQVDRAIHAQRPGGQFSIQARDPNGVLHHIMIPVHAMAADFERRQAYAVLWSTDLALPLFCFALGFSVAAIRIRDPLAWLLLFLMLSFAEAAHQFRWDWQWRPAALLWHEVLGGLWPTLMMLFGLYFPYRSRFDIRAPWIKWIVIALNVFSIAAVEGVNLWWRFDVGRSKTWAFLFRAGGSIALVAGMIAISLFFAALGHKSGTAPTRDARQRLRLLWAGATLAFTPLFLISLRAVLTGRQMFEGIPSWVAVFALCALPVFPLTLAYVIVVQRAMNLRGVIRSSLRYGLARQGLKILQMVAISGAALAIFHGVNQRMRGPDQIRIIVFGVFIILLQKRLTVRASEWIDRKFFREAYSAERVLIELSEQARNFTETLPLLELVTERVAQALHVPRAAVLLKEGENYCLAKAVHDFDPSVRCLPLHARAIEQLRSELKPTLVYFDAKDSWVNAIEPEEKRRLRALDAQVLLPLSGRDDLVGVMVLGPKLSEEPYTGSDLRLLGSVGAQTGLAIENSELLAKLSAEAARRERINSELEIAREVQQRLFPQHYPAIPGIDYYGYCRPALGIGGDYYDFIQLKNGKLGVAIGDISGKGVSAALLMSNLHASLRGQTLAGVSDLASLVSNINILMYEASTTNRYATFFYSEYDPATRRLDFVNAGHNAPFIVRNGESILLEAGGPVVGLLKQASYEQNSCRLQPGDLFVAYTDGVSEAMTADDEEWGEERMTESVRRASLCTARQIIETVLADADAFTAGAVQHDDMTLSVIKVTK